MSGEKVRVMGPYLKEVRRAGETRPQSVLRRRQAYVWPLPQVSGEKVWVMGPYSKEGRPAGKTRPQNVLKQRLRARRRMLR